jgi:hypothetical protein
MLFLETSSALDSEWLSLKRTSSGKSFTESGTDMQPAISVPYSPTTQFALPSESIATLLFRSNPSYRRDAANARASVSVSLKLFGM